jgi:predicted O-methyltransferase YrrM
MSLRSVARHCKDRGVDVAAFIDELQQLFEDFPRSPHPRDRRFHQVLEFAPGLAAENNLALLNLAGRLLPDNESYVEIGTYRGTSLIAAALDNAGDFVAIDDFSFRDGSREQLERNLLHFGVAGATIVEGDAFELVPGGVLGDRRVGVYYYDAAHDYDSQVRGLQMIEPYLADEALVIVDDSDWEHVARADRDYLASQPRAELVLEIVGNDGGNPGWWEGVHLIAWRA